MSASWAVFVDGLVGDMIQDVSPERLARARTRALNTVARNGRAMIARDIREQIALPARYVSEGDKRLYVAQKASDGRPEAIIRASGRPTSLARYAKNPGTAASASKSGVLVEVQPGKARLMRKAFFLKLPQGSVLTDTQYNLGLAVRLKPGESLRNKASTVRMANGLYLLYGPSVDQVFMANNGTGIAQDRAPVLATQLEREFLRLLAL